MTAKELQELDEKLGTVTHIPTVSEPKEWSPEEIAALPPIEFPKPNPPLPQEDSRHTN